jgi:hypothetical protein
MAAAVLEKTPTGALTRRGSAVRLEGGLLGPDFLERLAEGDLTGQKPKDFGLAPGRLLKDEIASAYRDAKDQWVLFRRRLERLPEDDPGTSVTRDAWVIPFLGLLGYELRYNPRSYEAGGVSFGISHRAGEQEDAPPVHVVGIGRSLDRVDPTGRPRVSPHSLLQDFLNRSDHLWGIVTNGQLLRLLRKSPLVRAQAYVEFDLEAILEDDRFHEFELLYRLLHRTRLPKGMADAPECLLERYYQDAREQGNRARDRLRDGVEECLKLLGTGFLRRWQGDLPTAEGLYAQLLRLVYRFLFLLVAEERELLGGTDLYREHYSVTRLRRLVDRREAYTDHEDLWLSLNVLWHLLRDHTPLPQAGGRPLASLLGLPVLDGGLFEQIELEQQSISNRELLKAFSHLVYYYDEEARTYRKVNYAALDVEELGSVYESLLDNHPIIVDRVFDFAQGTERKSTGSYYTPAELVGELVRSALEPVLEERLQKARTREERERAILSIRVLDPACGSGHFLLAAARRLGLELARVRTEEEEPSPESRREATRDVIAHCIYAVDKNPLAVELCKVALWIEAQVPSKPLTFLDHRVRCGDSLVGILDLEDLVRGVPDAAYERPERDAQPTARELKYRNRSEKARQALFAFSAQEWLARLARSWQQIAALPEETALDLKRKEARYQALRGESAWDQVKTACDLWVAAFFLDPSKSPLPTTYDVWAILRGEKVHPRITALAAHEARRLRFFHWPLEFPDAFAEGGFDVVLSNPPWGQKTISADSKTKHFMLTVFPSSRGIFDFFRPFLELAIRLTRLGGWVGLVLPDILLLKNYEATRVFVLRNTSINKIDWWPQPFSSAVIDVITMALRRGSTPAGHQLTARVHEGNRATTLLIPQQDFWENDRRTFNLFLTEEKRRLLEHLRRLPCMADFFDIHEGVHSGNIRHELFVPVEVDSTCRPLILSGSEVQPYCIRWAGNFIRLAALPERRTRQRYANLGRREWHAGVKVIVRRTGDKITAAVDDNGYYVSNNLFLILARDSCGLDLWGLCAFLNSSFATWFLRTIEPREGRAFAEVKIKHLRRLPLPESVAQIGECARLNSLGAQRGAIEQEARRGVMVGADLVKERLRLEREIDEEVRRLLGLPSWFKFGRIEEEKG